MRNEEDWPGYSPVIWESDAECPDNHIYGLSDGNPLFLRNRKWVLLRYNKMTGTFSFSFNLALHLATHQPLSHKYRGATTKPRPLGEVIYIVGESPFRWGTV